MGEGLNTLGRRNTRAKLRIVHPRTHMRGYSSRVNGHPRGNGGTIHALRYPDCRGESGTSIWLPGQPRTCDGNMCVVQPGPRVAVGGQATVVVISTTRRGAAVATPWL